MGGHVEMRVEKERIWRNRLGHGHYTGRESKVSRSSEVGKREQWEKINTPVGPFS
jgi:hypothetical protein